MSLKNLSVKNKNHKKTLSHLRNKKTLKIYKEFSSLLNPKECLAVAVSGGPDSLSLAFLAKCFSLINKVKVIFLMVDHKLRKESSKETNSVCSILKKIDINCKVLNWHGKKPLKNIQSLAREKRYQLLVKECKKNNINNLLVGHHLDDMVENFIIRLTRGSGLKGLISFNKRTKYKSENLEILRPLLNLNKKDLILITKKVFKFYIKDPSNKNEEFKRIRVRNLLQSLEKEGLDKNKLILTMNNLKDSDRSIKFYEDKNMKKNVIFLKQKKTYILKREFFDQAHEIIFRSLTKIMQKIGEKYYPVRGKNINELIDRIDRKSFSKITLGGCFIERVNETILISKEN
ncbi:tRNA lysidine(34) synthetase TilS [Candidatus Pelagibacter bacterium]|nr:tRNA lysidine(34) synthetase TilS [Candidatus Pelagibacter bacterium]